MGLRAIIAALVRRPIKVWSIGGIVIIIVVASFLMVPQIATVTAASESPPPLDCLSCHTKTLKRHDKLGPGNRACWVCHDSTDMKMLRLGDGSLLSLSESSQLCGRCHQERYDAWKQGTHGIPGTVAAVKCTSCHNQHQPQIALLDITKPHPEAQLSSSPPSDELLKIFGISLLLLIAAGVVVATTRGEGP